MRRNFHHVGGKQKEGLLLLPSKEANGEGEISRVGDARKGELTEAPLHGTFDHKTHLTSCVLVIFDPENRDQVLKTSAGFYSCFTKMNLMQLS